MKPVHIIRRLFSYIARYRLRLVLLAAVSLVGVGFEIIKPLPVKIIIDNVLASNPTPSLLNQLFTAGQLHDKKYLLFVCLATLVVIVIGSAIMSAFIFNFTVHLSQRLVYDLSVDFFSKLQRLSLSFHAKNRIGDLLNRINGDVFVVYFLVAQIILPVLTSLVCLGGMFYIMIQIDLVLAMVAFAVIPVLGLTLAFFAAPMSETAMTQYTKHGLMSAFVQQCLSSMKVIQAFGRESFMHEKMKAHAEEFSQAYKKANRVSMTYNQLSLLITGLASACVIGIGAYRGLNGHISTGDLFVFLGYITALYGPVTSLSTAVGTAVTLSARGRRIFDILDSDEVVQEKKAAVSLGHSKGKIEFKNVSFGYGTAGQGQPVLTNISFAAYPGEIVAIVGPTGAGKTSLISLLTRFYDPWSGRVLVDDIDIKDVTLHSLRENISVVLQDAFLFPMTIAENIAFGNPSASFDEVVEAAKAAQAHEFILRLPEGYHTLITENGASLSGGQRQRIAIARAFLKKAPILILDEPTSAVDALTEARIFKALEIYASGKTVFLISHRLSTLKHADQIIAIKDGCVAESGTHEGLLAKGEVYADLYQYQHIS